MPTAEDARNIAELIRQGRSDEDVERLTGASLSDIVAARASAAAASTATAMRDGLQRLTGYQPHKVKPRGLS